MQFINIVILLFLFISAMPNLLKAQCDESVNQIISVDDFPIELTGSTTNSGDDFVVYVDGGNDTLAGYFTNDVMYKFTIGFSDEDGDGARAALGRWKAGERTGASLETAASKQRQLRQFKAAAETVTAAHARGQLDGQETKLSDLRVDQPQENCRDNAW